MNQVLENVRTRQWAAETMTTSAPAMIDEAELLDLRERISVLAMQKQYWWQQCGEVRDALRTAECEVAVLREALRQSERLSR